MGRWKMRAACLALCAVFAAQGLAGCSQKTDDAKQVIQIDDVSVPFGVVNFYARMQQASYETYYPAMMQTTAQEMWKQEAGEKETYESSTKKSIIESIEELYLLSAHAKEYNVSLSDEEKEKIAEAAKAFVENNDAKDLELVSGTQDNVQQILTLMTVSQKMQKEMTKDVDTNVSDEEAAQKKMEYVFFSYTDPSKDQSQTDGSAQADESYKAAQKEKAQSFLDSVMASDGHDMQALSSDGVKVQTATFDKDTTTPDAALIGQVDALSAEGDVTGLVETDSGIYIGKLVSLMDREATDAKKDSIVNTRKQDKYTEIMDGWKKEAKIKVDEKVWKKVSFDKLGVTIKQTQQDDQESK